MDLFDFEGDGWLLDVEKKTWREVDHPFKNKPRYQSGQSKDLHPEVVLKRHISPVFIL